MSLTSNTTAIVLDLITIHANLVTSDNSLKAVLLAKLLGDVRSELHTDTTLAGSSAVLLLGVRPEHLHHQTSLAWLSLVVSVQFSNVIECDVVVREQASVEDQVLLANESSQCQSRETLREQLKDPISQSV
jgi:hypothetical protein